MANQSIKYPSKQATHLSDPIRSQPKVSGKPPGVGHWGKLIPAGFRGDTTHPGRIKEEINAAIGTGPRFIRGSKYGKSDPETTSPSPPDHTFYIGRESIKEGADRSPEQRRKTEESVMESPARREGATSPVSIYRYAYDNK